LVICRSRIRLVLGQHWGRLLESAVVVPMVVVVVVVVAVVVSRSTDGRAANGERHKYLPQQATHLLTNPLTATANQEGMDPE